MSLRPQNIGAFDRRMTIQSVTNDDSTGQRVQTWANAYTDVAAKEIKASGSETVEEDQVVAMSKRAWVIRKFDRTITTQMRVVYESENYYITSVHPHGDDRRNIVIETEARDND